MAEPVHDHAGDGFHVGRCHTFGFPIDAACKAGDCIVQRGCACRIDRLRFGRGDDRGLGHRKFAVLLGGFLLQDVRLVFGHFLFFSLGQRPTPGRTEG